MCIRDRHVYEPIPTFQQPALAEKIAEVKKPFPQLVCTDESIQSTDPNKDQSMEQRTLRRCKDLFKKKEKMTEIIDNFAEAPQNESEVTEILSSNDFCPQEDEIKVKPPYIENIPVADMREILERGQITRESSLYTLAGMFSLCSGLQSIQIEFKEVSNLTYNIISIQQEKIENIERELSEAKKNIDCGKLTIRHVRFIAHCIRNYNRVIENCSEDLAERKIINYLRCVIDYFFHSAERVNYLSRLQKTVQKTDNGQQQPRSQSTIPAKRNGRPQTSRNRDASARPGKQDLTHKMSPKRGNKVDFGQNSLKSSKQNVIFMDQPSTPRGGHENSQQKSPEFGRCASSRSTKVIKPELKKVELTARGLMMKAGQSHNGSTSNAGSKVKIALTERKGRSQVFENSNTSERDISRSRTPARTKKKTQSSVISSKVLNNSEKKERNFGQLCIEINVEEHEEKKIDLQIDPMSPTFNNLEVAQCQTHRANQSNPNKSIASDRSYKDGDSRETKRSNRSQNKHSRSKGST
eukprot:TRINITY_DN2897_c0_g1_i5.p1 TRINITY_DN2897_c0_g1~~TRINITY_DN2897_c0_g1_i5.p1  ORF type:complete len:532 (-),score=112.30 TRINITY_DN2897_c0_g1_i5:140-1708(-)